MHRITQFHFSLKSTLKGFIHINWQYLYSIDWDKNKNHNLSICHYYFSDPFTCLLIRNNYNDSRKTGWIKKCKLRLRIDFLTLVCRVVRKRHVIFVLGGKTGSRLPLRLRVSVGAHEYRLKRQNTRHFIDEVF